MTADGEITAVWRCDDLRCREGALRAWIRGVIHGLPCGETEDQGGQDLAERRAAAPFMRVVQVEDDEAVGRRITRGDARASAKMLTVPTKCTGAPGVTVSMRSAP